MRSTLLSLLCFFCITSCTPLEVGLTAGAAGGIAIAQDRPVGTGINDAKIQFQINEKLFQTNIETFRHLNVIVFEGRVLLIGQVKTEAQRSEAVAIAWQIDDVIDVYNEITIGPTIGVLKYASDSIITSKLKAKLTFDKDIHAVNYKITTVKGVVYIMGIAQNKAELNKVIYHARNIKRVKKVVNYVRIKKAN